MKPILTAEMLGRFYSKSIVQLFQKHYPNGITKWNLEEQIKLLKTPLRMYLGGFWERGLLKKISMAGVDLSGLNLAYADLKYVNLKEADLKGVNLKHADLYRANLIWADLTETNLEHAYLIGADLKYANLTQVCLKYTILDKTIKDQTPANQTQICNCDINILLRSGCQCGGT